MKIKVNMTAQDLFAFSMYNAYSGFTGAINIIFTVGALVILCMTWNWDNINIVQRLLLVCCALLFTVVQPAMLKYRSNKRAKMTGFSATINLTLTDEKFGVEKADVNGDLKWDQIWRVIHIRSLYIVELGPTRAYLIPERSVEGREQELVEIFKRNLPKSKMKGLKA